MLVVIERGWIENVKDFKIGDKVSYAGMPLGSYSSHRNYPTKKLVKVPR